MTYKTFKNLTRKLAQAYNSESIEVFEDIGQANIYVSSRYDSETNTFNFKFKNEIPVQEGQKRQLIYYTDIEIFKK